MKRILCAILVLQSFIVSAQENYFGWENPKKQEQEITQQDINLKIENESLLWQKVYNGDYTFDEMLSNLQNCGKFSDIAAANGVISCYMPATAFDIQGAGFKRGGVPMYLALNDFTAFIRIQIKDGRYRVTVSDIVLIANQDTSLGKMGEKISIETYAIKRGELSQQAYKYIEPILTNQLDKIFNFSTSVLSDNW